MKLPAALLVGGSDGHKRRLFIRDFVAKCLAEGFVMHPMDGEDRGGIQSLVSTVGVLFPNPTLVVVTRPEKIKPDDVSDHLSNPNPDLVFLFVSEADKPTGGILDGFPAAQTKLFPLPPFYKLDEYAADYARELAKSHGMDLADGLSRAVVKKVGNDLGVIYYEIDKAVRMARVLGVTTIEPGIIRATIASLTELDGSAMGDALGTRSTRLIADELTRYKLSKKGDPTIELCGRVLTPMIFRWLQATYLQTKGISVTGAAGRVGASPWYWEHKVLPSARMWGLDGCKALLNVISRAQAAVFDGVIRPWGILETGILRLAR